MAEAKATEQATSLQVGDPISKVETAKPGDASSERELAQPLTLSWSFGFNPSLPVHNISDGNRKMLFYSCNHTGVLYDCIGNSQYQLQGHGNPIRCTAVSGDRRWLVTADTGKGSLLTVWDSYSGIPVRTFFDGLGDGCIAVDLSHSAQYLATLSVASPQVVSVWDWTSGSDVPVCQATLHSDCDHQFQICFNRDEQRELTTNGESQAIFYFQDGDKLKFHSTPVSDKDFGKPVGMLSQTCFVPGSTKALTGTSEGCGVIWESVKPENSYVKKPLKLAKITASPITVVTVVDQFVVTGDSSGQIRFHDPDLKLINWYDNISSGPLASISFACAKSEGVLFPSQCSMAASTFVVPDFSVSTSNANIAHVTTNGTTVDVILKEHDAAVNAIATHPSLPRLVVGSYSCQLKLWDYQTKQVLSARCFDEPCYVQCVAFDPKGEFVGVGFTNGVVGVLDSLTLEDSCQPFCFSREGITHITFSQDSRYIATADLDMCVSVYVFSDEEKSWKFLAKHRSHYKHIQDLMFGVKLDSSEARLLSLGKDRKLVEYDLVNSSEDDLKILNIDRIEQSAVPTAMAWYPPLTKESFIITANDQYKLKLYNSTTKMCRKTLLGPTYGSPIKKVRVFCSRSISDSGEEIENWYLAYITTEKVGLLILPHDGNPHNSMCLVAHPGLVSNMAVSCDGQYLFTAGGEDCIVSMWTVSTNVLEAAALFGGKGLVPFYAMLDGGKEGEFFKEMEEYFYYAQIKSQGPNVTCTRRATTTVPIDQIPFIMRAIGFYPSEEEIGDMLNEVKFSDYVDTEKIVSEINLETFIKLYVNHRPAFGLSPTQLTKAFRVIGERREGEGEVVNWSTDKSTLLRLLQEKGEHMTEVELVEYLMTLLGYSDDPEISGAFTESVETALQELPEHISAKDFAEELLGLTT